MAHSSMQLSLLEWCDGTAGGTAQVECDDSVGSVVYFVENRLTGLVKIGVTADIQTRLVALRTAAGSELVVLKTIRGGRAVEKTLHRRFAAHRVRGEWFRLDVIRAEIVGLQDVAVTWKTCSNCGRRLANSRAARCYGCEMRRRGANKETRACCECSGPVSRVSRTGRCASCQRKVVKARAKAKLVCLDCAGPLGGRRFTRCRECYLRRIKARAAPRACVDCGALRSRGGAVERCRDCDVKRRRPHTEAQKDRVQLVLGAFA